MYTIYGKEDCAYCKRAKDLLDSMEIGYEYHDVRADDHVMTKMMNKCKALGFTPKVVPQIFDEDGKYVGGYTELHTKLKITG